MKNLGIYIGLIFIIIGLSAIIFKKYPGKKETLRKLNSKYENINENRVAIVDGVFYSAAGVVFSISGFFSEVKHGEILFLWMPLAVLIVLYYLARKRLLSIK